MRSVEYPRYFPLGDSAVTVEFGDRIDEHLNRLSISLASRLDELRFPGFIESVPAYASTSIFYEPQAVRRAFPHHRITYEAVIDTIRPFVVETCGLTEPSRQTIVIPVDFSAFAGPDLEHVAINANVTVNEVISILTSTTYRVYMLGFLPGFPYMGQVDERIACGRKLTPRPLVPRLSVGIAGHQTGIYPFDSPGGWQIIGKTECEMFRADSDDPSFLKPGDRVRFSQK